VVEVPAELRSRVFDRLAIPDTGRTADRMARFLTWVLSRREPLLVAGPEGSGGEVLVELVHEARGDGGTSVQVDAELEPAGAVLAILDVHYGGGAARTDVSGVILRGAHTVDPQVVDRVVAVARVLVRGDEVGPPLYVSAQVGHPLVQRFADEAGGDVFVIPALGERPQDILPGLSRMLRRPRPGGRVFQTVSPGAAQLLQSYHWPGNVDEMREVVEAARLISGGTELRVEDLPVSVVSRGRGEAPDASPRRSVPATMRGRRGRPEKKLTAADIKAALEACDGSRTAAARRLGVSRTTLWRKMAELGEAILDADPGDATRRLEDDGA
jgi:transcriptional regulator of acetoin/glycerol metabolism